MRNLALAAHHGGSRETRQLIAAVDRLLRDMRETADFPARESSADSGRAGPQHREAEA